MRYKLRQSNHTISPLDQSLASALRMEFHTFPNAIFELLTAAQRPGGGGSPLTVRHELRQSNHTIGPLDQSLASARRMKFDTF